jgi:hypothetical protein
MHRRNSSGCKYRHETFLPHDFNLYKQLDWDDAHKYGREPQKSEQTTNSGALLSIKRVLELLEGINQNLKRDKSGFVSGMRYAHVYFGSIADDVQSFRSLKDCFKRL